MTEYFGLDEYTYNLLIEYFKSNPEIKIVRIFGSRISGSSRRCSDIDMFIEGTYSEDKVKIFNNELNCLRHPYRIDIISVNETEDIKKELVLRRLRQSKCFYLRKNYIDNELNEPYVNNFVDEFDNIDLWFYIFRCRFILNLEELYRLLNQSLLKNFLTAPFLAGCPQYSINSDNGLKVKVFLTFLSYTVIYPI